MSSSAPKEKECRKSGRRRSLTSAPCAWTSVGTAPSSRKCTRGRQNSECTTAGIDLIDLCVWVEYSRGSVINEKQASGRPVHIHLVQKRLEGGEVIVHPKEEGEELDGHPGPHKRAQGEQLKDACQVELRWMGFGVGKSVLRRPGQPSTSGVEPCTASPPSCLGRSRFATRRRRSSPRRARLSSCGCTGIGVEPKTKGDFLKGRRVLGKDVAFRHGEDRGHCFGTAGPPEWNIGRGHKKHPSTEWKAHTVQDPKARPRSSPEGHEKPRPKQSTANGHLLEQRIAPVVLAREEKDASLTKQEQDASTACKPLGDAEACFERLARMQVVTTFNDTCREATSQPRPSCSLFRFRHCSRE